MEDSKPTFLVGVKINQDGSKNYSHAAQWVDRNGKLAASMEEAQESEKRRREEKFAVPTSVREGTANKVFYAMRNARMLQEEILQKNEKLALTDVQAKAKVEEANRLIRKFKIKLALLSKVSLESIAKEKNKSENSSLDYEEILALVRNTSASSDADALDRMIQEWEDELDSHKNKEIVLSEITLSLKEAISIARDLSMQLSSESGNYVPITSTKTARQ